MLGKSYRKETTLELGLKRRARGGWAGRAERSRDGGGQGK